MSVLNPFIFRHCTFGHILSTHPISTKTSKIGAWSMLPGRRNVLNSSTGGGTSELTLMWYVSIYVTDTLLNDVIEHEQAYPFDPQGSFANGLALESACPHLRQLRHRSRIQNYWRLLTPLRRRNGNVADQRPCTARACFREQRHVNRMLTCSQPRTDSWTRRIYRTRDFP